MGEAFKRQQAKNHKKGRDRALVGANRFILFRRPEILRTVFTLRALNGAAWTQGERLLALTEDSAGPVFAVRGHEKVGVLDGPGAHVLREAIGNCDGPKVAELRITSFSGLSGAASAEVVTDMGQ